MLILSSETQLNLWIEALKTEKSDFDHHRDGLIPLQIQLEQEGFLRYSDLNKQLTCIQQTVLNGKISNLEEQLETLGHLISPIDVDQLDDICQASEPTLEKIRGQEATFLIGRTGHGKSTLLHKLAGSGFEEVKQDGSHHLNPIPLPVRGDSIQHIQTSPEVGVSTTSSVDAIDIWTNPLDPNSKSAGWFCDTPGFSDRRGPTIDIANMLSLTQAMQACSAVRVVLLVSAQDLGAKFELLDSLIEDLIRFHPAFTDHLDELYIVVRLGDYLNPEDFRARLRSYHSKLRNRPHPPSQPFMDFVQEIIDKLDQDEILFSDFANKRGIKRLVQALTQRNKQRKHTLTLPKELYGLPVDEASRLTIHQQANRYKTSLESGLQHKHYDLVTLRLTQLWTLTHRLNDSHVSHLYEQTCQVVSCDMNQRYQCSLTELKRAFLDDDDSLSFDGGVVQKHIHLVEHVKQLIQTLSNAYHPKDSRFIHSFDHEKDIEYLIEKVKNCAGIPDRFTWTDVDVKKAAKYMIKINSLNAYFPNKILDNWKNIQQDWEQSLVQFETEAQSIMASDNVAAMSQQLKKAQLIASHFHSIILHTDEVYQQLCQNFCQRLEQQKRLILSQLTLWEKTDTLPQTEWDQAVDAINLFLTQVEPVAEIQRSHKPMANQQQVYDFSETVKRQCLQIAQQTLRSINTLLSSSEVFHWYNNVDPLCRKLSQLQRIDHLSYLRDSGLDIFNQLNIRVEKLSKTFTRIVSYAMLNHQPVDHHAIFSCLQQLDDIDTWTKRHPSLTKNIDIFASIKEYILRELQKITQNLEGLDVGRHILLSDTLLMVHPYLIPCYQKLQLLAQACQQHSEIYAFMEDHPIAMDAFSKKVHALLTHMDTVIKESSMIRTDFYDLNQLLKCLDDWESLQLDSLASVRQKASLTKKRLINHKVKKFHADCQSMADHLLAIQHLSCDFNTLHPLPDPEQMSPVVLDYIKSYQSVQTWEEYIVLLERYTGKKLALASILEAQSYQLGALVASIRTYINRFQRDTYKLKHIQLILACCQPLNALLKDRSFAELQTLCYQYLYKNLNEMYSILLTDLEHERYTQVLSILQRLKKQNEEVGQDIEHYLRAQTMISSQIHQKQQDMVLKIAEIGEQTFLVEEHFRALSHHFRQLTELSDLTHYFSDIQDKYRDVDQDFRRRLKCVLNNRFGYLDNKKRPWSFTDQKNIRYLHVIKKHLSSYMDEDLLKKITSDYLIVHHAEDKIDEYESHTQRIIRLEQRLLKLEQHSNRGDISSTSTTQGDYYVGQGVGNPIQILQTELKLARLEIQNLQQKLYQKDQIIQQLESLSTSISNTNLESKQNPSDNTKTPQHYGLLFSSS